MTPFTLILRSLRFHWRAQLGVLLGTAVGSAVLIGALLVGDSVRLSLRDMAVQRLGKTEVALVAGDRLFRDALAGEIAADTKLSLAPALQLLGTGNTADGSARANHVQVLGVDERFWSLANQAPGFTTIADNSVVLNQPLADQLKVKTGDTILLRVPKPSQLSRDAPLSPEEDTSTALRLQVQGVVTDDAFGRFSLQANQVAPFNAFLPLAFLQKRVGVTNRANLLLAASAGSVTATTTNLTAALRKLWTLADADVQWRVQPGSAELRTGRVFLDPPVVAAAEAALPHGRPILTYFVNEMRDRGKSTPYSMVTAAGAPLTPAGMRDDEILLNQWLADDLSAKAGDSLSLSYYIVGDGRKLEERSNTFTVRGIVPMEKPYADRTFMPDFPGMTDAENCRDWDTGFPIKTDRIRDKDEKYWHDFRGTPKAFITLAAGQKAWGNRFGNLTAIRIDNAAGATDLGQSILAKLDPATLNLRFDDVRSRALAASAQSQDFGGLFIGFSLFLIVAALLLTALLFQFGIEQRSVEIGTLLAIGFTPKRVKRLLLIEGGVIALAGGLLGLAGGTWYAQGMLHGLTTIWRSAVGTSSLHYHATMDTLAGGVAGAVIVALFTIWLALRKQVRQPARELLAGEDADFSATTAGRPKRRALWVAIGCTVVALPLTGWAFTQHGEEAAGSFFSAGALLLVATLSFTSHWLTRLAGANAAGEMTLTGLGIRNTTRRRKRSLATVAMLACGSFLIISIGAFRVDENEQAGQRSSGTGGFAFLGEASLPVHQDLNEKAGRDFYNLSGPEMKDVHFVPFRVRDGDDASCLNLNRAQRPRLLGVKPAALDAVQAFTFAEVADGVDKAHPWLALRPSDKDTAVPAIADQNSILWALGKKVGDTINYVDEQGREFPVKLVGAVANSILQGNLIIDESQFIRRFPGESGYRMFLIDAPSNAQDTVSTTLTKGLRDVGLELTPATRRLAAFNAVQNTYLSTFQVLGGLGLILGSIGLGVVVLRNVLERRGELGLLLAVGFRPSALRALVLSEHGALLLLGLLCGTVAAGFAVLPTLLAPGAEMPYGSLALTLGGVLLSGAAWTYVATVFALRGHLLSKLRND